MNEHSGLSFSFKSSATFSMVPQVLLEVSELGFTTKQRATASLSAVAVTPTCTINFSIHFFPYPYVGGLNPSGVSLQDSHIQRQNPYQPILIQECQKEILTIDTKQCCQVQPSLDCNQLVHHRYGRVCGLHGVDGRQ